MFGRLTGISRRVDTLATKVGDATRQRCRRCRQPRVSFFMQDLDAEAVDNNGRPLLDVQATRPTVCVCGQSIDYTDVVFVTVAA